MFSFAGTAQEAGGGARLGAVGILGRGSLMGRFSVNVCMLLSLFFLSTMALWLALLWFFLPFTFLKSETECPVAWEWSPTPVGMIAGIWFHLYIIHACVGSWLHVIV